jgi:hypothetical protein
MAAFISNKNNTNHEWTLKKLFNGAQRLDWHIAFASEEGVENVRGEFEAFLEAGHAARVIVGLDYFHTDPGALYFSMNSSRSIRGGWNSTSVRSVGNQFSIPKSTSFIIGVTKKGRRASL